MLRVKTNKRVYGATADYIPRSLKESNTEKCFHFSFGLFSKQAQERLKPIHPRIKWFIVSEPSNVGK